jgi:ribonuclease HII
MTHAHAPIPASLLPLCALAPDSKALTAAKRSELFSALKACNRIGWVVHSISAAEISAKMMRK